MRLHKLEQIVVYGYKGNFKEKSSANRRGLILKRHSDQMYTIKLALKKRNKPIILKVIHYSSATGKIIMNQTFKLLLNNEINIR